MKIDRLLSIIMILLNNDRVSAGKLAETFEVSRRTIYRDLDAIAMSGVPIVTFTGADGGVSIMKQYKVDKRFFTYQDIQKLVTGLKSAAAAIPESEITGILEKIKGLLPKDKQKIIQQAADQISIDVNPWISSKDYRPILNTIQQAFSKNHILSFTYFDGKGEKSERRVEPYQLVSKSGHWYLRAFCLHRNDFRTFRLSRMSDTSPTEETFIPRDYQPTEMGGDDDFRQRLKKAELLVHKTAVSRLTDIFGELEFTETPDGRYHITIPFMDDDYSYSIILSLGDKCECISPKYVREELSEIISRISNIYNN